MHLCIVVFISNYVATLVRDLFIILVDKIISILIIDDNYITTNMCGKNVFRTLVYSRVMHTSILKNEKGNKLE